MRAFILPWAAGLSFMQLVAPASGAASWDLPRIIATAGVLGSLTVLVYRLGVWRKEMESRLDALDHVVRDATEFKQKALRWHRRTVQRLERLEDK